jgi:hypothetical protein
MKCWELKKKRGGSLTWRLLGLFFTDGITERFKTLASYGDVIDSLMEMPTDSPRDSKRQLHMVTWPIHRWKYRQTRRRIQNSSTVRWRALFADRLDDGFTYIIICWGSRRQKLIYPLKLDPILPYFSFFFLISTLPNCKKPAPPPQKKISLFSAQQVIYLEVFLSQHPCWDLPTDFYQFL